jgi:hypothetical protein
MPCPLSDAGCTLRPTHRLSASRCSVTPLGHPSTAQSVVHVTGRGRTCVASRFRRALYRLSYGHVNLWPRLSVHLPSVEDRRSRRMPPGGHGRVLCLVRPEPERCCPCHSPTLRPWIIVRRLRISGTVDVLRGGALEPDPRTTAGNWQAKAHANCLRLFSSRGAEIFLSQAGPQLDLERFTLNITSGSDVGPDRLQNEKGDRLGRPRLARNTARRLARTTPREGGGKAGPVHLVEAMPARLDRGGRGRVGEERVVVESHQHRLNGCCRVGG